MKRAILIHRVDFIAILALVASAMGVVIYILLHQPAFTFGQSYYRVNVDFSSGAAVTAGQGQTVDIAGVQVGQVGGVRLSDGHAVVQMNIQKKYAPVYGNATVLLRPRTPLKDMYLALDPGTPSAGKIPDGGHLGVGATQPDVNFEEILGALDTDTRNYLLLLLSGGAQAFRDHGNAAAPSPAAVAALRGVFQRFAPLNREGSRLNHLLAQRRVNITRAIHNLGSVTTAIGQVGAQLTSLLRSSDTNFAAISSQDAQLSDALSLLPGTLAQANQTLGRVQSFANNSTGALRGLVPFARALGPALQAARPLFRDTTPVIARQLRPFARAVRPVARVLSPAAATLARSTPPLSRAISELNVLFNTLAYQSPKGGQGYLFWASWLSHNANSLASTQDAHGPIVRGAFIATCGALDLFEVALVQSDPALGPLIDLLHPPDYTKIKSPFCPAALPTG